ncbi:hypothetical protein GOV10_03600 [Candidatus Woesearchaeota archaeon]|nr:hypothetical protein [Candidatus Woesearchaeota archaeon]
MNIESSYNGAKEWRMDPKGYFVIKVFYSEQKIGVRHYPPNELGSEAKHDAEIFGTDAYEIVQTIVREQLVDSMQHAAYLGHELHKAEVAMRKKINYNQDELLDFEKPFTRDPSENLVKPDV